MKLQKRLASLLLAATMLASAAPQASAEPLQPIVIDGTRYATAAIHRNGSLLVSSVFLRRMGVSVQWDDARQAVVLRKGTARLSLTAGPAGLVHKPEGSYVPLRYATEKLGMSITYDAATGTASVATAKTAADVGKEEDIRWLERITEAESGSEPYEGRVAVAATILNRVGDPDWPDSIQDVIFQIVRIDGVKYYQFSPVLDGRIYQVEPSEETKKAVRAALNGSDPTGGATVFYNPDKTDNQWVRDRPTSKTIGNHVFAY